LQQQAGKLEVEISSWHRPGTPDTFDSRDDAIEGVPSYLSLQTRCRMFMFGSEQTREARSPILHISFSQRPEPVVARRNSFSGYLLVQA